MQRRSTGFTLIELMIVVAIIAILAAIAVPTYQNYTIRSQVAEGLTVATGAKAAVWDFISNTGYLPPNNASAGLAKSTSITGNYVVDVDVSPGLVQVTFGNKANQSIQGATLALSPITKAGSLEWVCKPTGGTPVDIRYLPSVCRQ